jgi:hypothetical protein
MQVTTAYLDTLNSEQRRAVEHGVTALDCTSGGPLLVIAGAGSGKTNTLAHRVAHLIVNGADPRRILLMTFSRRAAAEMTKRVERISRKAMGGRAGVMTDALTWAGTFHGIGARLLREYSDQIGLDQAFTIHDREDSADLMNLVRHGLGFSKTVSRFPTKGRVVGWCVADRESATLFAALFEDATTKHPAPKGQLTLHADRGGPMRAKATALLLADLGVTKSHSRPHTSNDNPFSESHFKTMKYQPQFPQRFGCIQDAKTFCRSFFDWYNQNHHHAGIGLMTPDQVHLRSSRPNPRCPPNHTRRRLQQKPRTLCQKGARTTCKADRDLVNPPIRQPTVQA